MSVSGVWGRAAACVSGGPTTHLQLLSSCPELPSLLCLPPPAGAVLPTAVAAQRAQTVISPLPATGCRARSSRCQSQPATR